MVQQGGRQVEVDDDEEIVERVAAIDVAKASGMVCTRVPHASKPGRRVTSVWSVNATTNALCELAEQLSSQGIERVVLESTSDYWRPFYYLLEAQGLVVWLVNARDVKNVPGRPKTDKLDAVWLARLNERGMLRASFIPPVEIRALRDYTRLRLDLTRERSRHTQRLEKLLEDALIKLSSVATDILGVSARAMIEALIAGQRDPKKLAKLARGRMRVKHAALVQALTGRFTEHHAYLARMLLDQIDGLTAQIQALTATIETALTAIPEAQPPEPAADAGTGDGPSSGGGQQPAQLEQAERAGPVVLPALDQLAAIPGISRHSAQVVLAEIGLDMSRFPTAKHLVSWAKLSPQAIQSGANSRSGKTGKGNPYLKGVLGEAAAAAAKTNTFLGERYRRLVKRTGKLKALVAVARSILVIIWQLLADPTARFVDLGSDYHTRRIDRHRKTRNLVQQLEALGHQVTLQPAA
jgi:transposase